MGCRLEVYNPSESQVDLKGFSLSGGRNERHVIPRNVLVRPRSFALLAYSNHLGDSEHLHVDYIYRCIECPVFRMGQTQGAIAIIDPFGRTVDKVGSQERCMGLSEDASPRLASRANVTTLVRQEASVRSPPS